MFEEEFTLDRQDQERIIKIVQWIKQNQGGQSKEWTMRNLYLLLEQQGRTERPQKTLKEPLKLLFSQNLFFSPRRNHEQTEQKIIHGQSLRIRNSEFLVVFTLLTSNTMTVIVKHSKYDFEAMVTIDVRDLSRRISSRFKDTITLFKYLQSLRKVEARLTDEGALEILIEKRAFEILQKIDQVYAKLTEIADGALEFNQSDIFERIVQHRHHPEKPIPSHLQQLIFFHPPMKALETAALDLFKKCDFLSAAKSYRFLINDMLRNNPFWQAFQGRGNDNDILPMLNEINQGNMQFVLKDLSYFDCLFICEYLNIDLERATAWYRKLWQQFARNEKIENLAVIYGILNFCHQRHCYFLPENEIIRLCKKTEEKLCKGPHQIAASELLIGVYQDLSKRQPSHRQQYHTKAVVLARATIGLDPTNEAAWLLLCTPIMNNTLNIVQNRLFNGIRYEVIQAEIWMKHPNDIKKADVLLQRIIKQNPYYRAAYYASLKLEKFKLMQALSNANPNRQLQDGITRAEGIFGKCSQQVPNDIYSRYLLARILQLSDQSKPIIRADKLYRQCIKQNPFMEKAKIRLENIKKMP